ncbi:MAG: Y-family DNA polymerase [Acidobacteriota bacterium]|nr:Y-family DNA polymerase [Acidobacteriota bacterium]
MERLEPDEGKLSRPVLRGVRGGNTACLLDYVSCERVFNPKLCGRPVVVLSNNDDCIIARSDEAKAVGVKMGAPLFQIQKLIDAHRVEVYSSNYALYGNMCTRVMDTLREISPEVEVYSIDEAFVGLSGVTTERLHAIGRETSERVRKWTGIPVSIGIAPTKTLAKVAAYIAKKSSRAEGVVNFVDSPYLDAALARVPVENVWGVGRNYARRLKERGIGTARDLRSAHDGWVRKEMGVAGLRILYELRGTSCLPLESCPPPKKGITVSRSFGRPVESLEEIREAVAAYVSRAGRNCAGSNSPRRR